MKKGISFAAVFLSSLMCSGAALSAMVKVYYEGVVDGVTINQGSLPYSTGDVISGTLTIDTSIPAGGEYEPGLADYYAGDPIPIYDFITGFSNTGGWNPALVYDSVSILDGDLAPGFAYDSLYIMEGERSHLSAPNGDHGTYDSSITLQIEDYSMLSINGTGLAQSFVLDQSSSAVMRGWLIYSRYHIWNNNMESTFDSGRAYFHLTHVSMTPVPAPGTALLMVSALASLALGGWRRRSGR